MSWHFSQALVEEYLAGTSSDGEPFAPSSGNPTPQAYLSPDRMTAFSRLAQFGMTFAPLTGDHGEELLTWFRAGFPVRTSAQPERARESTGHGRDYGRKWSESLAKYDPVSASWKTAQYSLLGDSEPFSETWPRWGMTAAGESFRLPTPERPTSERGSGLWVGTPTASMTVRSGEFAAGRTPTPAELAARPRWASPASADAVGSHGGGQGRSLRPDIHNWKRGLWPTPTVDGNYNRKGASEKSGDGLATAVAGGQSTPPTYPTPKWTTPVADDTGHRAQKYKQGGTALSTQTGGQLNPEWVELLMGWSRNWTSFEPISRVEYVLWLMGFEGGDNEVLRVLRSGVFQEEIQRAIGRSVGFPPEEVLLSQLRQYSKTGQANDVALESQEVPEIELRGVRGDETTGGPSLRPEPGEQRPEQLADALLLVPQFLARYGQEAWKGGRWENDIARVASGVAARVDRLKAIGNGQVPAVAALAWRILSGES